MSDKERFYDEHVAPALVDLAAKCEAAGLSFVASVEWAPGESGSTVSLQSGSGLPTRIAAVAARSRSNADTIIFAIMDYAHQSGHSSICLKLLGVPEVPAQAAPEGGQ